jgi:hypothetical protein
VRAADRGSQQREIRAGGRAGGAASEEQLKVKHVTPYATL